MQSVIFILISLGLLGYLGTLSPGKIKPSWVEHLKGRQKLLGLLAIVLTLLIALNPEVVALGLVADTAFFDLLALAISLQFQMHLVPIWHPISSVISRSLRWLASPGLGASYLLMLSALALTMLLATSQSATQRISGKPGVIPR